LIDVANNKDILCAAWYQLINGPALVRGQVVGDHCSMGLRDTRVC